MQLICKENLLFKALTYGKLEKFQKNNTRKYWLSAGQPDPLTWLPRMFFWLSRASGHPIFRALHWPPGVRTLFRPLRLVCIKTELSSYSPVTAVLVFRPKSSAVSLHSAEPVPCGRIGRPWPIPVYLLPTLHGVDTSQLHPHPLKRRVQAID